MIGWVSRHIFGLLMGLFWIIALAFLLAFWTVSSDSGTRWLLESAAPRIVDGLKVNGVTGNLISKLQIEDVHFENCQNEIGLTRLVFSWQPGALTQLVVDVNEISADTFAINPVAMCDQNVEQEAEAFTVPEKINIPLDIRLGLLRINRILVGQSESAQIISNVELFAVVKTGTLEADLKNLDFETLNLSSHLNVKLESPYELMGNANWGYQIPGDQYFSGTLALQGNINHYSLNHKLLEPFEIQSRAALMDPLGTLKFDTEHSWSKIKQILPDGRELMLHNGRLKIVGGIESARYDLETSLDTKEAQDILISGAGVVTPILATLAPLSVKYESMQLETTGAVNFEGPIAIELGLTGKALDPGIVLAEFPGNLDFDMDIAFKQIDGFSDLDIEIHSLVGVLREYPFEASGVVQSNLKKTELREITVQIGDNLLQANASIDDQIELKLSVDAPELDQLAPGVVGGLLGDIELTGEMEFPHIMNAQVNWLYQLQDAPEFSGRMDAAGDMQTLQIKHQLQSPYEVQSAIKLTDILEAPVIDSSHLWDAISQTLPDGRKISLRNGNITVKGSVEEIKYTLDTSVDVKEAQNIMVSGAGKVTQSSALIESLTVDHESMQLGATGTVFYDAPLSAKFQITGTGINPGILAEDYPGDIDIDAKINYAQLADSNDFFLDINTLKGILRDYQIQATGIVDSKAGRTDLHNISLSVGDNTMRVNGSIKDNVDLSAQISAPSLDQIVADLSGSVSGVVDINGIASAPAIKASLESASLKYGDVVDVSSARIVLDVDNMTSRTVHGYVEIDSVRVAGEILEFVRLNLQGTQQKHQLSAKLDSTRGTLNLDLQGGYLDEMGVWAGSLHRLDITETVVGDWASKTPVNMSIGAHSQKLDGLCLINQQQEICVDYSSEKGQPKSLVSTISEFDLEMVQSFLVEFVGITGKLNGAARFEADVNDLWRGNIDFSTDGLILTPPDDSGSTETLEFSEFFGVLLVDEQSELDIQFKSNRGDGAADFSIQGLQTIDSSEITEGRLNLNIPDLTFLNPYLNGINIESGQSDIDMDITGPLLYPALSGSGLVEDIAFTVPEIGIRYSDASIIINAEDYSTLDISASLESGVGKLSVKGDITMNGPDGIGYDFSIEGNDFPVMDTPDIVASISPDLSVRGNEKRMSVGGNLLIPELDIVLNDAPPGVDSVSRDEVIINATEDELVDEPFPVLGALNVSLGEKAHFKGYGLDADLAGKLAISLNEKQAAIANGILSLVNAEYFALGQTLKIAKGDVIFSGPIDDPTLD